MCFVYPLQSDFPLVYQRLNRILIMFMFFPFLSGQLGPESCQFRALQHHCPCRSFLTIFLRVFSLTFFGHCFGSEWIRYDSHWFASPGSGFSLIHLFKNSFFSLVRYRNAWESMFKGTGSPDGFGSWWHVYHDLGLNKGRGRFCSAFQILQQKNNNISSV